MDFLPPAQLYSAVAVQTLALPCTLILCITSMLRERSIHHHDEKRLVRLYKQHAFAFELFQFFVALIACGFVSGNTLAAIEARSLVIDFASEDVTSMIVRNAIKRNCWLVASAFGVLACMSMLDSWSLPESLQDLTDPLFRLTRELVRSYIWRHNHDEEDRIYNTEYLSCYIEQPHQSSTPAKAIVKTPVVEADLNTRTESARMTFPTKTFTSPNPPPTAPPTPTELETEPTCFPDHDALIAQAQAPLNPPAPAPASSATPHPLTSRPRYQNQTLTSALRATSKSPKARSRKRSVTFADQSDGEGSGRRERSLVRGRAREIERKLRKEGSEDEETLMSSSAMSKESEDGDLADSQGGGGGEEIESGTNTMGASSEAVED